jgi:cell division protein ZapA
MTIKREDEYVYRQAEKLIKERFNLYTKNYPGQNAELYLVMALVDIAVKYKQQETSYDTQPILDLLRPLLSEVEKALDKS